MVFTINEEKMVWKRRLNMLNNKSIKKHYAKQWTKNFNEVKDIEDPLFDFCPDFSVLEFPPFGSRTNYTYATCGLSTCNVSPQLEFHMFSSIRNQSIANLLASVAYYHAENNGNLGLWHSINFGEPWQGESLATYGLISLPYLDGPKFERGKFNSKEVSFYWIVPITEREKDYKKERGVEALEQIFEASNFDYSNANRPSLI